MSSGLKYMRVLEAILHVDFGLDLSRLHPAGERADCLPHARQIIEREEAFQPSMRTDQIEIVDPLYRRVYSFGGVQVKFAAALCSPFPKKCATAG
jgi:hypothetical protein